MTPFIYLSMHVELTPSSNGGSPVSGLVVGAIGYSNFGQQWPVPGWIQYLQRQNSLDYQSLEPSLR